MKDRNDPSVIRNAEEQRKRLKEQWWKWWANNLDRENIIQIGMNVLDWDVNAINEILKEKWFAPMN